MTLRQRSLLRKGVAKDTDEDYDRDVFPRSRSCPPWFWLLGIGAIVIAILAFSFGLGGYLNSSTAATAPIPSPPIDCNYSSWSQWSFTCFQLFNGSLGQLRSQTPSVASASCPAIVESMECDVRLTLVDTQITKDIFCEYNPYTSLCSVRVLLRAFIHVPLNDA